MARARRALCSALRSAREVAVAPVTTSRPRASPRRVRPRTWAWACSGPRRRSSRISADQHDPAGRLGQQLGRGRGAQLPGAAARLQGARSRDDDQLAVLDQAQARRRTVFEQRAHGLQRRAIDLRAAGGRHQRRSRRAERALACDRALLLAHEARHAQDDEAEEHHRRADDDEQVEVAPAQLLRRLDDRRDERRHGQQGQSQRGQARYRGRARAAGARASRGAGRRRPRAGRS